ncbi:hypothetical protein [Burkholderia ubonensis]|uniref:hypothetical protein n=1 Tax=Burkholderia ubonensis TaxID=101571 RepID=UPI0012FC7AF9|nr:hypothetical protein [Burkholderia ubonensis]
MGRSSGSDDASRAGIGHASASNRRQRAPYMNIQVFMMDDCATQGYGLFIPNLNETLLDVCPIRRRQLRRAARVREFSCRRNDCSAKGYAPTSCNNSRFQLHNSFTGNQNSNKLFAEFSKYENLPHKMKLSIRGILVTWNRHPVFNSLYCFKK